MIALDLAILHLAALFVPSGQRDEWYREWRAELWHLVDCGRPAAGFCLGAFRDAFWLRRNLAAPEPRAWFSIASPAHCLAILLFAAASTIGGAFVLPGTRALLVPAPYRDPTTLVAISEHGHTAPFAHFEPLLRQKPRAFQSLAFCRILHIRRNGAPLTVAVTPDLSDILSTPVGSAGLVFTRTPVRLPIRVDAWLQDLSAVPPDAAGFLITRILASPVKSIWTLTTPSGGTFECATLVLDQPLVGCLAMAFLALLILPATTSLRLGDYPAHSLRRWLFLAAKVVLVLPIVAFGALDLVAITSFVTFQVHGVIVAYVVVFHWVLVDQRARCPVCLRKLTHPTRIGDASQVFLEWFGTELICKKGHGLLHVPEISTSSYTTQRWFNLDPSWSSLFS